MYLMKNAQPENVIGLGPTQVFSFKAGAINQDLVKQNGYADIEQYMDVLINIVLRLDKPD